MNAESWKPVVTALLGSWPNQVAAWGREALAAYVTELAARGISPESALVAIRSCPAGQKFPPSAPELAALGRFDPSRPTFEECYRLVYGRRGILRSLPPYTGPESRTPEKIEQARRDRAAGCHPLVASFVDRYGLRRLSLLEVDHPEYGDLKRRELREAWERHCEAMEGRDVAALASGRRDGLRGFDPLAVLRAFDPDRLIGTGE